MNIPELQATVDDDRLKADGRFLKEKGELAVTKAAIDERLDEHGYSVSGLGDAGDRMFGKK
ncbi:MAG: uracil phosphoribosyltransferase [Synechococcus sp.]